MNDLFYIKDPNEKQFPDVFKNCPRCESSLFEFEGDVFCTGCQWNSVEYESEAHRLGFYETPLRPVVSKLKPKLKAMQAKGRR